MLKIPRIFKNKQDEEVDVKKARLAMTRLLGELTLLPSSHVVCLSMGSHIVTSSKKLRSSLPHTTRFLGYEDTSIAKDKKLIVLDEFRQQCSYLPPIDLIIVDAAPRETIIVLTELLNMIDGLLPNNASFVCLLTLRTRHNNEQIKTFKNKTRKTLEPFFAYHYANFEPATETLFAPFEDSAFRFKSLYPIQNKFGVNTTAWSLFKRNTASNSAIKEAIYPYIGPKLASIRLVETFNELKLDKDLNVGVFNPGGDICLPANILHAYFTNPIDFIGCSNKEVQRLSPQLRHEHQYIAISPIYFKGNEYDLFLINASLTSSAYAFTHLIEAAERNIRVGGYIILFATLKMNETLDSLKPFFLDNFDSLEPSLESLIQPLKNSSLKLEMIHPIANSQVDGSPLTAWLTFKKIKQEKSIPVFKTYYQSPTANTFLQKKLMTWLKKLKNNGATFGFPESIIPQYYANHKTAFILKHDIHHDLRRAVLFAQAEAEAGIQGIYFMLGPHELNANYYDSPLNWQCLQYIQSLGHKIGLHIDLIDTILTYGDLYSGIKKIKAQFEENNIMINYANTHGNTKYRTHNSVLAAGYFFKEAEETESISTENHKVPDVIRAHRKAYSLKELNEEFNISYWVDSNIIHKGKTITPTHNLSDNNKNLMFMRLNDENAPIFNSETYDIDDNFKQNVEANLDHAFVLTLLHPQQYE